MSRPTLTRSWSLKYSRSFCRAALMAGCDTKTRSEARVTFFSCSSASSAMSRLRSNRFSCMVSNGYPAAALW